MLSNQQANAKKFHPFPALTVTNSFLFIHKSLNLPLVIYLDNKYMNATIPHISHTSQTGTSQNCKQFDLMSMKRKF